MHDSRIKFDPDGTTGIVHLLYSHGEPYQHARESLANALEAGATRVEFSVNKPFFRKHGTAKLTIEDNGCGMSGALLLVFFGLLGKGSKHMGLDGNFGIGAKIALLPWNQKGVVICSWTEDNPEGAMIWIEFNGTDYVLHEWYVEAADGRAVIENVIVPGFDDETGIDWSTVKPDWMTGSGTVVTLLGNSFEEDTVDGDTNRKEGGVRHLTKYLNSRFLSIPDMIKIGVCNIHSGYDQTGSSKTVALTSDDGKRTVNLHPRVVHGITHYIPPDVASGTVTVDEHGTQVYWALADEAPTSKDYAEGPLICVDYKGEAYSRMTSRKDYARFGVTNPKVAKRLWLIIRPPVHHPDLDNHGVITDSGRAHLKFVDGTELPFDAWRDEFFRQMPAEIKAALDDARADSKFKMTDKIRSSLAWVVAESALFVEFARGTAIGGGGTQMGSAGGSPRRLQRSARAPKTRLTEAHGGGSDGNAGTHPVKTGAGGRNRGELVAPNSIDIPDVQFVFGDDFPDEEHLLACYDQLTATVYINEGHPWWLMLCEFYRRGREKAGSAVDEYVKDVYATDIATKVYQTRLFAEDGYGYKPDEIERLLSPEALTLAIIGMAGLSASVNHRLAVFDRAA